MFIIGRESQLRPAAFSQVRSRTLPPKSGVEMQKQGEMLVLKHPG